MKITDIKTYLTMPIEGLAWLFVEVETDEGVTGVGECTDYFSNPHLVRGIEAVKPLVVLAAPPALSLAVPKSPKSIALPVVENVIYSV